MKVCKRCVLALMAVLGLWGEAAAEPVLPGDESNVRPGFSANAGTALIDDTQKTDYILKGCQEMPSEGDPTSAERFIDPAGYLVGYYYEHFKHEPNPNLASVRESSGIENYFRHRRVRLLPDDQPCASLVAAKRYGGRHGALHESTIRSHHALLQSAGRPQRHVVGKPLQIQSGTNRSIFAGVLPLY